MNKRLQEYLCEAPHLYPQNLERQFPRVLSKIVAAWSSRESISALFSELLIDQRGDRQGFPPEIVREIFQLSIFYDGLSPARKAASDVWRHEPATAALEKPRHSGRGD